MEQLRVTADGHYLETTAHQPFFYLGDTAWELFHRLNREEARCYLGNRARKGFTVIQAVVLAEFDGLHAPNPYGDCPLLDDDPTRPNPAYFAHVDAIVAMAGALGLYIGMLPTWGDKVGPKQWGIGPEVFTPENAYAYGIFLGQRYREAPIIWVVGGDRPIESDTQRAIWRALAAGLRAGDGGAHLMTFHPVGASSSTQYVGEEGWVDFHMLQSGHNTRHGANYRMILTDRARHPGKPVLDGEARYEDHPIDWKPEECGWFTADDVREATYWSLLAGACGITYGCHDIWQFWQAGREPISFARTPWQVALDFPGSSQMQFARALYEARPYTRLVPYQEAIQGDAGEGGEHVRVARDADGSFLFAYLPTGAPLMLAIHTITGQSVEAHWLNPRNGDWIGNGNYPNSGTQTFTPPSNGAGQDWLLVLDDAAKHFPAPAYPWAK